MRGKFFEMEQLSKILLTEEEKARLVALEKQIALNELSNKQNSKEDGDEE